MTVAYVIDVINLSNDQHRVAIAVKAVFLPNCLIVRFADQIVAAERRTNTSSVVRGK